ncbi:MAG: PD40 domain-containing protein [Bacteroidetes bacterium]|nr:PD40 domain-containing protein [Bacteroidota bacterium]
MKTRVILVVVLMLVSHLITWSQTKGKRERGMQLYEADYYVELKDYGSALAIYNDLYLEDKGNIHLNFKIGKCLFYLNDDKSEAVKYFKVSSEKGFPEAHFYLARCLHIQEKLEEAIDMYLKYKNVSAKKVLDNNEIDRYIDQSTVAMQMIRKPIDVEIKNIGGAINSAYPDYVPLTNADETMMIFTSRRKGSTGGLLDPNGKYFEDIYISRKVDGKWSNATSIGDSINTDSHDASVGLSADGRTLIIYRTNKSLVGGDLYESVREGDAWSTPVKYGENINSRWIESDANVSADGNVMYFTSDRPGGYGGADIYIVKKINNLIWSMPLNLGPTINTAYDERSPYIHPDNTTLFFSSKGHKTMGGFDIFSSTTAENNLWSEPENIGSPINTVSDDIYFFLSADGEHGYYSSNGTDTVENQDIYVVRMPYPPKLLTVIKGTVYDSDSTHVPLQAKITVLEENKSKLHGLYKSNSASGKYLLVLNPNIRYKVLIETNGYHTKTEYLEYPRIANIRVATMEVELDRIEK